MRRGIRIIVGLVLLLSVVVVFVSPYVDLDPSTLRAAHAALMIVLSIAGCAFLLLRLMDEPVTRPAASFIADSSPGPLLDLVCSRIC